MAERTYDKLRQVISGRRYWADGTPVAGQQFEYAFDDIGNRRTTAAGGDQAGANLRHATYSADNLNRYTSRTVPGFMDMLGAANSAATVTLWGSDGSYAPTTRRGDYFRGEVPVTNTPGPVWLTVTNLAVLRDGTNADIVTSITREVFVPGTPEAFGYDADGNLTNDGRWVYTWGAENRLSGLESKAGTPTLLKRRLDFTYDHQGRRIQKIVSTNNGTGYFPQTTNRFAYDGWNLVAVLDPQSSVLQTFTWGLDASGTMEGAGLSSQSGAAAGLSRQSGASAGGVGGLLWVTSAAAPTSSHFAAYDGNGNVAALVSAADGTLSAQYEYAPFGELLRATGPMAEANPFRFSTKYQDDETELVYYGLRFLKTSTGGWLSRDPLSLLAGTEARYELLRSCGQTEDAAWSMATRPEDPTEYVFSRNAPIMLYDLLGLCVPLPDSGPGKFHGNFWGHRFGGPASSLTFTVCCPIFYPYLATWGIMSPLPPPPITPHGANFPGNWTTVTPPSGSGPCYTIVINVTSTSTVNRWIGDPFIDSVRVAGGCCCTKPGTIQRADAPVTPPGPPAPRPPITPPGVTVPPVY